jgi:hypothetical protein
MYPEAFDAWYDEIAFFDKSFLEANNSNIFRDMLVTIATNQKSTVTPSRVQMATLQRQLCQYRFHRSSCFCLYSFLLPTYTAKIAAGAYHFYGSSASTKRNGFWEIFSGK